VSGSGGVSSVGNPFFMSPLGRCCTTTRRGSPGFSSLRLEIRFSATRPRGCP
jgi:hypothetical protein